MSTYDSYEVVEEPRRHKSHRHRHDRDRDSRRDRDDYEFVDEPRYVETKETYIRGNPAVAQAPDPPFVTSRTTDVIRRPQQEDSDLSIEEVRRDFPPPAGAGAALYPSSRGPGRDDYRARSADTRGYDYDQRGYGGYRDDYRGSDRDYDDHRGRGGVVAVKEQVVKPRRRSLSRNQKIISGVAGAALAIGAKELYDRRGDLKHAPEHRNILGTAAVGAAGAFAAYEGAEFVAKRAGKDEVKEKNYVAVKDKNGEVAEYYDSDEETVKSRKKPSRRKSLVDGALALAGVGGAKAALDSRDRRDRSRRDRDDGYSSDDRKSTRSRRSRRSSPENEGLGKVQQAAKAALLAGAAEAFRVRNEPGGWAGAKGKRILTAAIGASAIDAAADRNPESKSKRHILEAVIGGLAGNRLVNGSRREIEVDRDGRSVHGSRSRSRGARSRSRAPSTGGGAGGPLAALAAAGLAGLAGKKVLDRDRSRSRDDRRRRYSSSEDDRPRGEKKRSKSVTDYARKGLSALGIGEAANESRDGHSRDLREESYSSRGDKGRRRRGSDDDYDDRRRSRGDVSGPVASGALGAYAGSRGDRDRGGDYGDDYDDPRSRRGGKGRGKKEGRDRRVAEGKDSGSSSSDLGSSSGDEKRARKMKGKQLITAGLATVATIHAAHNVYQSVEKRDARHKAVAEGEMTPEEAHRLKMKARLQDAASIGIAALGIKGAYSVSSANS